MPAARHGIQQLAVFFPQAALAITRVAQAGKAQEAAQLSGRLEPL